MLFSHLRTAILAVIVFTVMTGLLYPLLVTGVAQLAFPEKANGSLLKKEGRVLGSELIGQPFSDPKYFWSRLSATSPFAYNAGSSGGSNFGPLNPALADAAEKRIRDLQEADASNTQRIPIDLVTSSGSGLDPHITVAAALYQVPRVARVRGVSEDRLRALVGRFTEGRFLGFFGEPGVNVLELNLAIDNLQNISEK